MYKRQVVRYTGGKFEIFHPSYKIFSSNQRPPLDNTLTPIYSIGSSKITQYRLRSVIKNCVREMPSENSYEKKIDETFSKKNVSNLSIRKSLQTIHSPSIKDEILKIKNFSHPAQKRLIVEELLTNLIGVKISTSRIDKMMSPRVETSNDVLEDFKKNLPFNLTNSQDSVIDEINEDLNQTKPMRRLVQGDVGSGKTVVAAAAMLSVAKNNFQTVLLCPTEVLAEQHFKNFSLWVKNEDINIALLTGKTKKNEWEKINK